MPCPCHAPTMPFFSRPQHGRRETAVLCSGLEKNGMVGEWHGHGMTSVNETRPHCVNQMCRTHYKPLAARHGRGTAWARRGNGMLCVNRPYLYSNLCIHGMHRATVNLPSTYFSFMLRNILSILYGNHYIHSVVTCE